MRENNFIPYFMYIFHDNTNPSKSDKLSTGSCSLEPESKKISDIIISVHQYAKFATVVSNIVFIAFDIAA